MYAEKYRRMRIHYAILSGRHVIERKKKHIIHRRSKTLSSKPKMCPLYLPVQLYDFKETHPCWASIFQDPEFFTVGIKKLFHFSTVVCLRLRHARIKADHSQSKSSGHTLFWSMLLFFMEMLLKFLEANFSFRFIDPLINSLYVFNWI